MGADAVRTFVRDNADRFLDELVDWLRIPSISADPAHSGAVRRSAEWLVDRLRRAGWPVVEVWETPGHPTVFAEWPSDEALAPEVVVYGHHDVQPIDPLELWTSPPFEPEMRGDELFARGAVDDKGQVLFHVLGLETHLAVTGRSAPAVTVKLLVEGEEESGSPHFAPLLRERADRLRCDAVVVSDTAVWARDTPSVCTGMRGLVEVEVGVHGPATDLHSGSFGGAVPNPLHVLTELLAGLHDEHGRIAVDGFYDAVRPVTDEERALFARLPFDESEFLAQAQSRAVAGEDGYSTLERVWSRPTCEINGMWGGYTGPGGKTIIPTDARAKLSFRLVPDQEPPEIVDAVRRHLLARAPAGVEVTVTPGGPGVRPFLTPLDAPVLGVVRDAMARAFGTEVLLTREGGSGPEADLADILDAPLVFLGVGLPDDRIHAPNERVVVPMLLKGAEAAAHLWALLPDALSVEGGQ